MNDLEFANVQGIAAKCRVCGARGPIAINETDAASRARELGWWIIKRRFVCPTCLAELQRNQPPVPSVDDLRDIERLVRQKMPRQPVTCGGDIVFRYGIRE